MIATISTSSHNAALIRRNGAPQITTHALPFTQRGHIARLLSTNLASRSDAPSSSTKDYFGGPDKRPIILFDGVCNMCNTGVNVALDSQEAKQAFRFAPLQSQAGRTLLQQCGRAPDDISSIVLVEDGQHSVKSQAILRIGQHLNPPLGQLATLGFIVPNFLRDIAYDQVANNRYNVFGKRQECRACDEKLQGADFLTE